MAAGVGRNWERGFVRDEAACARWSEPRFPMADSRVARFAATLPMEYKIRGGGRKDGLGEAARKLGVDEGAAAAPQKAARGRLGPIKLGRELPA